VAGQPSLFTGTAGATFDAERVYRYRLWRHWAPEPGRLVLWCMLNPSTADEFVLDPTLRRCQTYSREWGFDGFEVVNLFAVRATDPRDMLRHPAPVGPRNDAAILVAASRASLIICGWGNNGRHQDRAAHVLRLLRTPNIGPKLHHLGRNDDGRGEPSHPLYLAGTRRPQPFED